MSALIEFDGVCKYYQMGDTTVKAADHISMQINKGEFVAIVGQSGSGKSTCMNIIGCLDVPAAGSNTAVQTAVTLGGFSAGEDTNAALTRGRLAKLLVAFSAYRESANTQGSTGTEHGAELLCQRSKLCLLCGRPAGDLPDQHQIPGAGGRCCHRQEHLRRGKVDAAAAACGHR